LKELWVNHKPADFMNVARQQKVTPGCSLLQDEEEMEEDEGGQQLLWQQHLQQNQTTVQTSSVEAVSVCPAPGQGNTRVAADPDRGDTTVSKVQVTGFLLYWYVPQNF
jgi:hypothetical protein